MVQYFGTYIWRNSKCGTFLKTRINVSILLFDVCLDVNRADACCCSYPFHFYTVSLQKKEWCHCFHPPQHIWADSISTSSFIRHAGDCCLFRQTQLALHWLVLNSYMISDIWNATPSPCSDTENAIPSRSTDWQMKPSKNVFISAQR